MIQGVIGALGALTIITDRVVGRVSCSFEMKIEIAKIICLISQFQKSFVLYIVMFFKLNAF